MPPKINFSSLYAYNYVTKSGQLLDKSNYFNFFKLYVKICKAIFHFLIYCLQTNFIATETVAKQKNQDYNYGKSI